MTPIEIFEAWRAGKKLEYLGEPVTGLQFRVWTGEGLTAYHHDYHGKVKDIPEATISRETFGFDEARKRMCEGKILRKEGTLNRRYRIHNNNLQYLVCELPVDNDNLWAPLYGYPIDWPDSNDFYEVE